MKKIFLLGMFLFLGFQAWAKTFFVDEGAFVFDPTHQYLSWIKQQKELTLDHLTSYGYEVYGPTGTQVFLEKSGIPLTKSSLLTTSVQRQNYPSYEQIEQGLKGLADRFPHLTKLFSIGKTVEGRDLWVLKISNDPTVDQIKPEFKYISSMHGNEITGRELMMRFAQDLLSGYETITEIKSLIDQTEIFIMPSMNPDGSEKGIRGNGNGVDLNRNFPDFSTTDNTNSWEKREPETVAIMKFQAERNFSLSANFHGGAEVVNYAWDTIPASHPLESLLKKISLDYASRATYIGSSTEFENGITNGYAWYEVNGGMQDWSYYWYNDLQFTVELSNNKWPNYSTINHYYEENKTALLDMIQNIHQGAGISFSSNTNEEIKGAVEVINLDKTMSLGKYTFNHSEFYKVLEPGRYRFVIESSRGRFTKDVEVKSNQAGTYEQISL